MHTCTQTAPCHCIGVVGEDPDDRLAIGKGWRCSGGLIAAQRRLFLSAQGLLWSEVKLSVKGISTGGMERQKALANFRVVMVMALARERDIERQRERDGE